jgi:hypothetical protein
LKDGENHEEYFCQNLSAQIKNSTTVSPWKKHKGMFLSNTSHSFSVTTQKHTMKILPKCGYSDQMELVSYYSNPNDQTCVNSLSRTTQY